MRKLTLFIPGLFGYNSNTLKTVTTNTPILEKLLSFSTSKDIAMTGFINTLFQIFGFSESQQGYPVASITRLVDDDKDISGIWMRADPVSLRVEREAVILADHSVFELNQHEVSVLATDARQVFMEYGIELYTPTNNRWYLKLHDVPNICATPIHEVVGENIHNNLYVGKDKDLWNRLANNIQICLHNCSVNYERQQRAQLPINGVWIWGAGKLPKAVPQPAWSVIFSDEVTTYGLSKLTVVPHHHLPESLTTVISQSGSQDNILVVISSGIKYQQYYDLDGWKGFVGGLENRWFADVENLFKQKKISKLTLLTELSQELTITKYSFMKFWRRNSPLHSYYKAQ